MFGIVYSAYIYVGQLYMKSKLIYLPILRYQFQLKRNCLIGSKLDQSSGFDWQRTTVVYIKAQSKISETKVPETKFVDRKNRQLKIFLIPTH